MERRRFSFGTIVTEFLIVVLGVAVALVADGWRKDLADRKTERAYFSRLRDELTAARDGIEDNRQRVIQAMAAIDTILATSWSVARSTDTLQTVRLAVRAADYEFNPAGVVYDLTYRELLATGSLNLLRDQQVRTAITHYYRLAYRTADVVAAGDDAAARGYVNRLRASLGTSVLPDSLGELPASSRRRVAALFPGPKELNDELLLLRSRIHGRMRWLDRLVAGTDTILVRLNAK
jgi:hypothetical protein